jgi:aryl-alcohol dehydrogenase-like predicted oxidoreductase
MSDPSDSTLNSQLSTLNSAPLGNTGLHVTPIGFGAFKIGRNQGIKYPSGYDLPDDATVERLLNTVLDLGVNTIDTAPAYGLSEERIGRFLSQRRSEFVLSTKVGETFDNGRSAYDFSGEAVRRSVNRSLQRLRTDCLDIVFIHSNGDDLRILRETDCLPALIDLKSRGVIRAVGFSGKTVDGARAAMSAVDVLMVEFHRDDQSHAKVLAEAAASGVGVVVKKGFAAGRLPAADALRFLLSNSAICSVVVGGLNPAHITANVQLALQLRSPAA